MKIAIQLIILLLITQLAIAQKTSINFDKLLITNESNGRSVKLGGSINTLRNFGDLIQKDTLNPFDAISDDFFIKHTFTNIIFYESKQNKISSFSTRSNEIAIESKGVFSISPGDHLDDIAKIFSTEVSESRIITIRRDEKTYLLVNLTFSGFSKYHNKVIVSDDEGISLLFNPDTKILESIRFWIRP